MNSSPYSHFLLEIPPFVSSSKEEISISEVALPPDTLVPQKSIQSTRNSGKPFPQLGPKNKPPIYPHRKTAPPPPPPKFTTSMFTYTTSSPESLSSTAIISTTNTNTSLDSTTNTNTSLDSTTNTNTSLDSTTNTNTSLDSTTNTNTSLDSTTNTNTSLDSTTNTNTSLDNATKVSSVFTTSTTESTIPLQPSITKSYRGFTVGVKPSIKNVSVSLLSTPVIAIPKTNSSSELRTFTLVELQKRPPGLDFNHLERYLSPREFYQVFGITLQEFSKFPKWKQSRLKQHAGIF